MQTERPPARPRSNPVGSATPLMVQASSGPPQPLRGPDRYLVRTRARADRACHDQ
jgi:hypothetical protein